MMNETQDFERNNTPGEPVEVVDYTAGEKGAADADELAVDDAFDSAEVDVTAVPNPNEEKPFPFDPLVVLSRLIAGLAIEGSLELLSLLQESAREIRPDQHISKPSEELSTAEKTRFVTLGVMAEAMQQTGKAANRLRRLGMGMGRKWESRLRPFHDHDLLRPARKGYQNLVARGNETVQRWLETGRIEEAHGRALARATTSKITDRVVNHLESSDSTQALIRKQAETYLQFLTENPEPVRQLINNEVGAFLGEIEGDPTQLDGLVQEVADRYIAHLRENPALIEELIEEQADQYLVHLQENPEQVQDLIQDQSLDMAGEMMDEVRVRTVTIDTMMERLVRTVLRRRPRTAVAPPQVRRLAERPASNKRTAQSSRREDLL